MSRDFSVLRVCALAGALVLTGMGGAFAQAPAAPAAPAPAQQPRKPAPAAPAAQKPALGASEDEGPTRTSATYDDWVVRCERGEGTGGAKVCEVAQTLQIGNAQQGLTAQVVFGKLKSDAPLRLVLQLPVGVWLPAGAQLTVGDNGKPIPVAFKFCIRACIADVDLTPQQASAISSATGAGSLVFQDRNQSTITLPISLKGLSAALSARDKM
ncbi:invasion associated locus B family protein [Aquabacter cavernae]|uniref:invasion associated locus B family protein n=1 Tax=Aquabacter cavernae TaxID=2496029 RepID=UPI001FE04CC6|nr:invasion associated locus B family protein [Aquabacter cavernae]